MKQITMKVPDWVDEEKAYLWVAEGMSKDLYKKLISETLRSGMDLDLSKALEDFEKTREDAWKETKQKYVKKGVI